MTTPVGLHAVEDPEERVYDIAEIVGPYAWGILHFVAENFPCPPCAAEAKRLMRGLHDVVNAQIGNKIHFPGDLRYLHRMVDEAVATLGEAHEPHMEALAATVQRLAEAAGILEAPVHQATPGQLRHAGGLRVSSGHLRSAAALGGPVQEFEEIEAEIAAVKESIARDPAARLVPYVKRSGEFKGEIVDFTKKQYQELIGVPPKAAIVNKAGKVPWELALDVIADELGFPSDEALARAAERVVANKRELDALELELQRLVEGLPQCSRVQNAFIPCQEFPDRDCRIRTSVCSEIDVVAIRHPSQWSIHRMGPDDLEPSPENQVATARLAGEATRIIKDVGRFGDDPDLLGAAPQCHGPATDRFERCVNEVKAQGSADSPWAVCTATIGCHN